MENTKLENWTKRMVDYTNKTSNHLFINKNNEMFKVIPFKHKDRNMVATIRFKESSQSVSIREIKAYDGNSLNEMKHSFFLLYFDKYKAIPNFKRVKEYSLKVKEYLETEYDGTSPKTSKIKGYVKGLLEKEKVFEKKLD